MCVLFTRLHQGTSKELPGILENRYGISAAEVCGDGRRKAEQPFRLSFDRTGQIFAETPLNFPYQADIIARRLDDSNLHPGNGTEDGQGIILSVQKGADTGLEPKTLMSQAFQPFGSLPDIPSTMV
ncbi:MAG: hypothetical protein IKD69_05650 [Solobacterium sp.]|nr:hypothetical protein [Solobacterium sp.]